MEYWNDGMMGLDKEVSQNKNDRFSGFKSGYVAIAGAPNVGKSTLLNRLLGEKISITSKKPQTTRNRILGVVHRPKSQLIFLDTPGVHKAKNLLNTRIVDVALSALGDVDIILVMVDVTNPDPEAEKFLVEKLKTQKKPIILALNKIDRIKKRALLAIIDYWIQAFQFDSTVPISAQQGTQVENLLQAMEAHLPFGPPFFPSETITDLPEQFIAAEMIREKVFRLTGQEIPYATAVTVDSFTREDGSDLVKIYASINVERDSQKGIIIGKNGSKLKKIGVEARKDIERLVGTRVFLKLIKKT